MNNIAALYTFELKKIGNRKIVWITAAVMLFICILMSLSGVLFNSYTMDGVQISGYDYMIKNRTAARNLSGRFIDDALLTEMQEDRSQDYNEIYNFVWKIYGEDDGAVKRTDADSLYAKRQSNLQEQWDTQKLTSRETAYWQSKEASLPARYTYEYAKGYKHILSEIAVLNIMLLLVTAVCLSGVFSDERLQKTDQITVCCRNGRTPLSLAKILAGITFGLAAAVFLYTAAALSSLLLYGPDGYTAALQLILPESSWTLGAGGTVLLCFALYLAAAILYSILAMFLSAALKSSTAAMYFMLGFMLLSLLVKIGPRFRVASQIHSYLPANFLSMDCFTDNRLVPLLGAQLTNCQFILILYPAISLIILMIGNIVYRHYQVSSR